MATKEKIADSIFPTTNSNLGEDFNRENSDPGIIIIFLL